MLQPVCFCVITYTSSWRKFKKYWACKFWGQFSEHEAWLSPSCACKNLKCCTSSRGLVWTYHWDGVRKSRPSSIQTPKLSVSRRILYIWVSACGWYLDERLVGLGFESQLLWTTTTVTCLKSEDVVPISQVSGWPPNTQPHFGLGL